MSTPTTDPTPTATLIKEDLVNFQPTSNLYELTPPYLDNEFVVVTVSSSGDSVDDVVVTASDENGFAKPDSTQRQIWVLHRAENRTYAEALHDIGYEVV